MRLLRDTFAARLARAFTPDDFAAVFADPDQLSLFTPSLATIRSVLTPTEAAPSAASPLVRILIAHDVPGPSPPTPIAAPEARMVFQEDQVKNSPGRVAEPSSLPTARTSAWTADAPEARIGFRRTWSSKPALRRGARATSQFLAGEDWRPQLRRTSRQGLSRTPLRSRATRPGYNPFSLRTRDPDIRLRHGDGRVRVTGNNLIAPSARRRGHCRPCK